MDTTGGREGYFFRDNTSGRLDFISLHANRQRSLDRIHGYHQSPVSIARDQDAFQTIQRSAPDAHPLPDLEEGMRRPGQLGFHQALYCIDLHVGNRDALASATNQPEDSLYAQNPQPL